MVHQSGNNSIGRITSSGVVTNYTGTGISSPNGIVAGPDGALWFTNYGNNSIGRITTAGVVTNYTGTGHRRPESGSPPARTGHCGSPTIGNNSIGRITTAGVVTNYTGTGIDEPQSDHRGSRRGAVVHQLFRQLDRADHHSRNGHQLHRHRIEQPFGITAGPDGALWFTNSGQLDRTDHHRRGGHQLHRTGIV